LQPNYLKVDRNSLIGLGIIAAILGVWLWLSGPSKEQIARNKFVRDSIETVKKEQEIKEAEKILAESKKKDTTKVIQTAQLSDSVKTALKNDNYRDFAISTEGKETTYTIENNLVKATILNKGAQIIKVELKNYSRSGQKTKHIRSITYI
jgi:YidC/Oxa1 family membrane protein insertase